MSTQISSTSSSAGFRHEALLYSSPQEFLEGLLPFIRAGVEAGEPLLAVVGADKIELLRSALGEQADAVRFADMADVGRNPARIIPAWQDFVDKHAASGRPLRGIGEPIDDCRAPDELVECQRHESLLNLAFADVSDFWLVCPYDTGSLPESVIEDARRAHPLVAQAGERRRSASYGGLAHVIAPFDEPLSEPPGRPHDLVFDRHALSALRTFVALTAAEAGLRPDRADDLVLAVNEVAANSVVHGGGRGELRIWGEDAAVVCEVRDTGRIDRPLAGSRRPEPRQPGGSGLWIANHTCDLVQIRTFAEGSAVRLHMRLD
jgi:anti-sigma regulatory factor (Ser/Thr protein kinase)